MNSMPMAVWQLRLSRITVGGWDIYKFGKAFTKRLFMTN